MQQDGGNSGVPQPGQQIGPGGQVPPSPAPAPPPQPAPHTSAPVPRPSVPASQPTQPQSRDTLTVEDDAVSWTASEYIHDPKPKAWYVMVFSITFALAGLLYVSMHDYFGPVIILLIGGVFMMFAARAPHVLQYVITSQGIIMGEKQYRFTDFRSFSTIKDGALLNIQLNPAKRFMPAINLYFEPSMLDTISAALGMFLPFEDKKPDAVDTVARFLRF